MITCDYCHMGYREEIPSDRHAHDKKHQQCLESYTQTKNTYRDKEISWFRPKVENAGVYLALNELNPRLIGFSFDEFSGISEEEWNSIQQGKSKLSIGKGNGDGHDRRGEWTSLDGIPLCANISETDSYPKFSV